MSESWKPVEVTNPVVEMTQESFPGSGAQKVIHNLCVERMEALKQQCINADIQRVPEIQQKYAAMGEVLSMVHQWDPEPTLKMFMR